MIIKWFVLNQRVKLFAKRSVTEFSPQKMINHHGYRLYLTSSSDSSCESSKVKEDSSCSRTKSSNQQTTKSSNSVEQPNMNTFSSDSNQETSKFDNTLLKKKTDIPSLFSLNTQLQLFNGKSPNTNMNIGEVFDTAKTKLMGKKDSIVSSLYTNRHYNEILEMVKDYHNRENSINISKLSELLNILTGYNTVQECKNRVQMKDDALSLARQILEETKNKYQKTVDARRKCQSQINHLLQRKDSWTDHDINRFTELYREDISLEQNENHSQLEYNKAQERFDDAHVDYLNEIRERYVQEQLYSDKIRRASTWWTWGLITVHLTIFITLNLFVEPRRRAKFQKDLQDWVVSTNMQEREYFRTHLETLLDKKWILDKSSTELMNEIHQIMSNQNVLGPLNTTQVSSASKNEVFHDSIVNPTESSTKNIKDTGNSDFIESSILDGRIENGLHGRKELFTGFVLGAGIAGLISIFIFR